MLKKLYLHAKQSYPIMLRCKKLLVPAMFNLVMILSIFLLGTQEAKATHALGADLTYVCTGPNTFAMTLTVYRDCNGINLPNTQTISWTGDTGCSGSVTANNTTETDITPICPGGQSSCNGGNGSFGVEQHVYTAIITVPAGCSNLLFSWRLCCRNNAITTLNNPGGERMYVEAHYFTHPTTVPCNNSPVFLNPPSAFSCVGNQVFYNHGAVDYDGDSLDFQLTPCLDNSGVLVNYLGGHSGTSPLGPGVPVTIDPLTGAIAFSPTTVGVSVICILVNEYRNGVLIGSVMRDMQFRVLPCTNSNPILSGVNNQGVDSIDFITSTCFGTQLCFNIIGSDPPDPGDVLTMFSNGAIANSTFTVSGPGVPSGNQITGTFCWTPTIFDIGTHTFTVTIQDNACPLVGSNTFTYVVIVQANPNDPVDAGPDVTICVGDTAQLSATSTAPNAQSYSWSPAIGLSDPNIPNPTASPPSTTTYEVTLLYSDNCTSTDLVTVVVADDPALSVSPNGINVCASSNITLTATTDAIGMNFAWTHLSGGSCFPIFPAGSTGVVSGATSQLGITMCADTGTYCFQAVVTNPLTGCTTTEVVCLTVGVVPPEPACRNIYASTTGSATAIGSQFDPVTLEEALARSACNNSVIKLATGTYNIDNPLNITSLLTLEGGFIESQAWLKTSEIGATTINRTNANAGGVAGLNRHLTALEVFGSSNFRLQDLTITTNDAIVSGTSTYGIFMNNASNYNITRVNIELGDAAAGANGVPGCAGQNGSPGANGQDGLINTTDPDVQGGAGGNGSNSCLSGGFLIGGLPGRNISHAGAPIGDGGAGTSSSAATTIVDGGAGGGGGRGGPAADGGAGGASGSGGTPIGTGLCSSTPSGLGPNAAGGLGGTVNTVNSSNPLIANGTAGFDGADGADGIDGCVGAAGSSGTHVACRYQVGGQEYP